MLKCAQSLSLAINSNRIFSTAKFFVTAHAVFQHIIVLGIPIISRGSNLPPFPSANSGQAISSE
jgi:hypothetical protein